MKHIELNTVKKRPSNSKMIPTSIQKQQAEVLIKAIDNYISWRNNKNTPDNRNNKVGYFTWLRHFTKFGKERAQKLRTNLVNLTESNTSSILQNHLKNQSRLNNHSLDTYLLELLLINTGVSHFNL